MGADDYLVRPIYLRELSARLELLLAKVIAPQAQASRMNSQCAESFMKLVS